MNTVMYLVLPLGVQISIKLIYYDLLCSIGAQYCVQNRMPNSYIEYMYTNWVYRPLMQLLPATGPKKSEISGSFDPVLC